MEPERCEECGFDATRLTVGDCVTALRGLGRRWRGLFKGVPDEILRRRPDPQTWSALEYAAHTRDVIGLISWAMNQVLEGAEPTLPAVEPDPAGTDHGYNALEPPTVLEELAANAERMAKRADRALSQHWARQATVGAQTTDAGALLRHAVHDATHHLRDVEKGLKRLGV